MIVDFFLYWFGTLATLIAEQLPTSPVPPSLRTDALSVGIAVAEGAVFAGGVLPMTDIAIAVAAVAGVQLAFTIIRIVTWLLALAHIAGTK